MISELTGRSNYKLFSFISEYPFSDAIRSPRWALILAAGCA